MDSNNSQNYKSADNSTLLNFLTEIINYVAVIASLLLTFSLSIFVDTLSSTTNLLRTGFCFILNKRLQKNLKFSYNYGTERLETLSTLVCDALLILGSILIGGFAIYRIIYPGEVSELIIVAVIFKVICVLIDVGLVIINVIAYRKSRTKIAKTSAEGAIASFLFDFGIMISVLLAMLLRGWDGVFFIEPIISLFISFVISVRAFKRIKTGIREITDLTLDEESQLKILKVINSYYNDYESMNGINSHAIGEKVFIDFDLTFKDTMTYEDIQIFLSNITADLTKEFPENEVTLSVSSKNTN